MTQLQDDKAGLVTQAAELDGEVQNLRDSLSESESRTRILEGTLTDKANIIQELQVGGGLSS